MNEVQTEETEIKTRHKKKLEAIRDGRRTITEASDNDNQQIGSAGGTGQGSHSPVGNHYSESGIGSRESSGGNQGTQSQQGTPGRYSERIRPPDREAEYAAQGNDRVESAAPQQQHRDTIEIIDLEAEKERKRELNRQRQARYRENQRVEGQSELETLRVTSSPSPHNVTADSEIRIKNVTQNNAEAKLLTKEEAETNKDRLIFLYMKGTELLDDFLEVIVRDHEAVKIWAMDKDEAEMFAEMQLERARKDKGAARTVRILLKIYERWNLLLYAAPRSKASWSHIREHKGLSFR